VNTKRPHAKARDLACRGFEPRSLRIARGREEVAASIQSERVVTLRGDLLEEVDAARNEAEHGVVGAGPPVAISLGALVARQGERLTLVDQNDATDSEASRELMRRGDAGDARSANDDVRAVSHAVN